MEIAAPPRCTDGRVVQMHSEEEASTFTQIKAPLAATRRRAPLAVSVRRKRRRVVSRRNHAVRVELSEGSTTAMLLAASLSSSLLPSR